MVTSSVFGVGKDRSKCSKWRGCFAAREEVMVSEICWFV